MKTSTFTETLDYYREGLASDTLSEEEKRRVLLLHLMSNEDFELEELEEQRYHEYFLLGWFMSTILKKSSTEE